jgi:NAD(P)-dependent dehydrogenase (short-subunit alcohol dehydrogenase family)
MKLSGKVIIVTGAAKGIGLGCAKICAEQGASVVIGDIDRKEGMQAERALIDAGGAALFVSCDMTNEEAVRQLIQKTLDRFERLDCLLNNAGWHPPANNIDDISVMDFEGLLRLNLTSTFMACKYAVPHLRKERGSIINMSSEVGLIGQAMAVSYVSTKAALIGLTKALALDLAQEGVRVNAVCPAGVQTPLMREWAATQYDPQAALKLVDSWHPLGRMATAEEIGRVCAFLASDDASFITGQAICPDGGAALGYRR